MKFNKLFSLYKGICKHYFIISYFSVITILPLMYYDVHINTIFVFLIDDLSKYQIIFFLLSNFIICLLYHKVIQKLYKSEWMIIFTIVWIYPLITQIWQIVYNTVYYIYDTKVYILWLVYIQIILNDIQVNIKDVMKYIGLI